MEYQAPADLLAVCSDLDLSVNASLLAPRIPFIGKGNIWLNDSLDEDTVTLARAIIERALLDTAPGQLSVLGYDASLTGIFAPFASIAEGESRILNIVTTQAELARNLAFAADAVRATQDLMKGTEPSLLAYRTKAGAAIGGYRLIVLACDIAALPDELREDIRRLMRRGTAYGLSFLIISPVIDPDPDLYVSIFAPHTTLIEPFSSSYKIGHGAGSSREPFQSVTAAQLVAEADALARAVQTAAVPSVGFDELHEREIAADAWERSSAEGITFCVGRYGLDPMEITLGDELNQRHNALITGAVGQGKSNLIQVIIHSLCARYSPDELELYLLDFKEGVTFKAFAAGERGWLPHARTLGLESDVAFGQAVLGYLMEVYKRRLAVLKEHGYTSINKLRRREPGLCMPRILVVIDEFQMMFGDDADRAREIVALLEKSVRLFRAAGIHFVLASQTIGGNVALANAQDSIFAQVPVRIALKNSLTESLHTLGHDNPQAAFLRPHEAIVNLDYGAPAQNRTTVIAYADEEKLAPLREQWWRRAGGAEGGRPPYVFEGAARAHVASAADAIAARAAQGEVPAAYLGELISVDGRKLAIPLLDEPGRNIALIGTPDRACNNAHGMLQTAALSLARQLAGRPARFICCDASDRDHAYDVAHPAFAAAMAALGHAIEAVPADGLSAAMSEALEQADRARPCYLVLAGMDAWKPDAPADPFSLAPADPFRSAVAEGPARGLHLIGWWARSGSFDRQTNMSRDDFNTTVFLRVDPRSVQQAAGAFVTWTPQENRALAVDHVELGGECAFIPYAPVEQDDARALAAGAGTVPVPSATPAGKE